MSKDLTIMSKEMGKSEFGVLAFDLHFEKEPEKALPLKAFLFTREGKMLESVNVKNSSVRFLKKIRYLNEIRVFIAPVLDKKIETVTDAEVLLKRYKAYEPVFGLSEKGKLEILPVPGMLSVLWKLKVCRVRGDVLKSFTIHGITEDKPICNARVHICEVDRLSIIIWKVPDEIIKRIPRLIWEFEPPVPVPFPPDPIGPVSKFSEILNKPFGNLPPEKTVPVSLKTSGAEFRSALQRTESAGATTEIKMKYAGLVNSSAQEIRNAILADYRFIYPIFCHWPWIWPWFYSCEEWAVVYTDMNGRFDTNILYFDTGDKPDFYFWVEYLINGVWTTVYKPSKACHTYWDYACGTEVHIRITDPRVQWGCDNILDGEIVWIKTIGHGTSVHHIRQTNTVNNIQGVPFNQVGLTDKLNRAKDGVVYRSPFASGVYFLVQFSSGLPNNNIYYYRWSYKKIKNADLSPAPASGYTECNTPVSKGYTFEYFDTFGVKHFDMKYFKLGPFTVGGSNNLYIIPPVQPSLSPVNASELSPYWDQNTASMVIDTKQLADGLYEFKLELFDKNGNLRSNLQREIFQVPDYNTFTPSVNAPDIYLKNLFAGHADAFKMKLRIDNNTCTAGISKILVNGIESASNCCGFVKYGNNVNANNLTIRFRAYHPQEFADFNFVVQKGTCSEASPASASGMVIGNVTPYTRDSAGNYSSNFTPAALLGSCVSEQKAAFAESLHVISLAVDGNYRMDGYDAYGLAAFALEP